MEGIYIRYSYISFQKQASSSITMLSTAWCLPKRTTSPQQLASSSEIHQPEVQGVLIWVELSSSLCFQIPRRLYFCTIWLDLPPKSSWAWCPDPSLRAVLDTRHSNIYEMGRPIHVENIVKIWQNITTTQETHKHNVHAVLQAYEWYLYNS